MAKFYQHIDYKDKIVDWTRYGDLFKGSKDTLIQKYLVIHEFEQTDSGKKLLETRKKRSQYTNFMAPFVSRFASLIFKKDQDYSRAKEVIFSGDSEKEFEDIDGKDTPLDIWLKRELAPLYFLYGKTGIFVDAPTIEASSKRDELEQGLRPYFHIWQPQDVIDWQYLTSGGRLNELEQVAYSYKLIEQRESLHKEAEESEHIKYLYLDGGRYVIELYKKSDKEEFTLQNTIVPNPPLDFIPVALVERDSWMKDVAPKLIQLFNLESTLDNIHLFQAHQRIMAVGNFKDSEGKYAAGEANLTILVTRDGNGSIQIAEPANTQSLEKRIEQVKSDAVKIAFNQNRHLPSDSKEAESADTLKEVKEDFRALAVNAAKDIEALANRALYMYGRFKGIKGIQQEQFVKFDTEITEEDVSAFTEQSMAFADRIAKYPTWRKATDIKSAKLMGFDNTEEIIKEIEQAPEELEQQESDPLEQLLNGGQATGTEAANPQSDQG